ncbi:MAG: translesion error-prone DNA polymerase V autoproteolytic subunit [Candidatus Delongbacteria bacterium]|jgi:DNA polymerase V|nr:translesion error-prone DNA polymerase V autoproteolytic subunit [Candidatus Delongbacteria bacterium]MDD4205365.1 translesion error-prone DNA polymerase V autoproteolytic subunit [Candidatus Delongbacteria bacterium]MDY0016624.1 translesion error-prone DNA polymerase V autoproteolytic subunit [Candidatus Delongbacteria bacterium]
MKTNLKNVSKIFPVTTGKKTELPFYTEKLSAGFPSPASDYMEKALDLNEYLIKNPSATFFVEITGDSMINAGIHSGDILIVDRSLEAKHNRIVVAVLNGEFTVKRLSWQKGKIKLIPENPAYDPIEIKEGTEFEIWGVATNVIHRL